LANDLLVEHIEGSAPGVQIFFSNMAERHDHLAVPGTKIAFGIRTCTPSFFPWCLHG
jgi:hypothetical protein